MRNVLRSCSSLAVAAGGWHHGFRSPLVRCDVRHQQEVKLEGKLVQFVYRNPHSFVHIEAPDDKGVPAAMGDRVGRHAQLANAGVKRDSLKVGDEVVVTARPSRVPGEYRVLMVSLLRPSDGFAWGRRPGEVVE